MPNTIKPSPIALVVCDNVYKEPGGKTALVGLFNDIRARAFPACHPRMCVYVSVTDVRPMTKIKLDIVHGETDEPVAVLNGGIPEGTSPTTICDFQFLLENVAFKQPGRHFIRFWANGHLLLQRPFEVTKTEG